MTLVDDPDEVLEHLPGCCRGCGADLGEGEPLGVLRRQVHDIPPVRPVIVEHLMHRRRRGCGAVTVVARFPQPRAIVRPYRAADHNRLLSLYRQGVHVGHVAVKAKPLRGGLRPALTAPSARRSEPLRNSRKTAGKFQKGLL